MEKSLFQEILKNQIRHKAYYRINNTPPIGGILLTIKNNLIDNIIDGPGHVHPIRKEQYISLIKNVLKKYILKNCIIKINLCDIPQEGCFGFCKKIGDNKCFLLPNHRFTNDDIKLDYNDEGFCNFNYQKEYIRTKYKTTQINKVYTSCIPQRSKIDYFVYTLNNRDICDGWAYTGNPHGKVHLSNDLYKTLKDNNLAGETHVSWINHLNYKYVLYNDGNTLSDRMRLLLSTNSIIIYKQSKYEEFYSYKLKNKINYIEYQDTSEIREIIQYNEKTNEYNNIAKNNSLFVDTYLDYDEILLYTFLLINNVC